MSEKLDGMGSVTGNYCERFIWNLPKKLLLKEVNVIYSEKNSMVYNYITYPSQVSVCFEVNKVNKKHSI